MRVVVLDDPAIDRAAWHRQMIELLTADERIEVVHVNAETICTDGITGDCFFNLHGDIYPIEIEDALYTFFRQGGGLLHFGGLPFETPVHLSAPRERVVRTFGEMRGSDSGGPRDMEIDFFRARLGIQTYAPAYTLNEVGGLKYRYDTLLARQVHSRSMPVGGVTLSHSVPLFTVQPEFFLQDHRAYMARPICRDAHTVGQIATPDGLALCTSLLFVKAWGNPYNADQSFSLRPWAIFTGRIEGEFPDDVFQACIDWLTNPVVLKPLELEYAAIHPGETLSARARLHGRLPANWTLRAYRSCVSDLTMDDRTELVWQPVSLVTQGEDSAQIQIDYEDGALLLPVRVEIVDEYDHVRDYVESAFVVWDRQRLLSSPAVRPNGCYFDILEDDHTTESAWLSGTNWQDRQQYAFTWQTPNPLRIANDVKLLAEGKNRLVRTHYMTPGWFKAVPGDVYASSHPDLFATFEDGPALSERALRALEAHIMLFGAAGLILMPTMYTNLPPSMGNSGHWMNTMQCFVRPHLIDNQMVFARQMIDRFGDLPCISWDLYNEPNIALHQIGDWLQQMRAVWGRTGQMIGIGTFTVKDSFLLGENADWHSFHTPTCKTPEKLRTGKPNLFQEAWTPTVSSNDGEAVLEHYLHRGITWSLRYGSAGFMPWNWNMSHMNWRYGGGFVDYWDLELGCAVHADATLRRGFIVQRNWATFLDGVEFDQSTYSQIVVVYPAHSLDGYGGVEYLELLNRKNLPFTGVNDRDVAGYDLSATRIVILPLSALGFRASTYETLRHYVHKGGNVWAQTDNAGLDEHGFPVSEREIPSTNGQQPYGSGSFYWKTGYRGEGRPYSDLYSLDRLLDTLPLQVMTSQIPIRDGWIRFGERLSTEERTLPTDWIPNQKLPDRLVVESVEVLDSTRSIVRAWSGEGKPISIDGISLSSAHPLFVIRLSYRSFQIAGQDIRFTADSVTWLPQARLIDKNGTPGPIIPLEVADGYHQLHLPPWQQTYWIHLSEQGEG
jgi:hypothetical protein